jgi:hypothetical protein
MNSGDAVFGPVSVFCSYAHADAWIMQALEKQLSPLRRRGLIEIWYDRQIEAGDDWRCRIDEHLESSEIVLLLISSDFVDSKYCYEIEAQRALARHASGEATVIPIMARHVDIAGLPFANLRMLPTPNSPIVGGSTIQDKALADVCAGIREVVERIHIQRLNRIPSAHRPSSLSEPREMEAAIAHEISVGEYREVVVGIRTTFSQTLGQILDSNKSQYSCVASDVRSTSFVAKYSVMARDELVPASYRLSLFAPSLVAEQKEKNLALDPQSDFGPVTFLVKAEHEGRHLLRINLCRENLEVAESFLSTSATEFKSGPGTGPAPEPIASVDLTIQAIAKKAGAGTA